MSPGAFETRHAALELRAAPNSRRLEGYCALFGVEARIGDRFTEILVPGCFAAALQGTDIIALKDHDPKAVLSRTRGGSLRLTEDSRGLAFDMDVVATTAGNDTLELVRSGNAGGCSFGFVVGKDGERWNGQRRELRAIGIREISIVSAWPAYEGTTVHNRHRQTAAPGSAQALRLWAASL